MFGWPPFRQGGPGPQPGALELDLSDPINRGRRLFLPLTEAGTWAEPSHNTYVQDLSPYRRRAQVTNSTTKLITSRGPAYSTYAHPTWGGGANQFVGTSSDSSLAAKNAALSMAVSVYLTSTSNRGTHFGVGASGTGIWITHGNADADNTGSNLLVLFQAVRWINAGAQWSVGWNDVLLVLDRSGFPTVYVNGRPVYSDTGSLAIAPGASAVSRVAADHGPSRFTNGAAYQAASVWDRALTAAEARRLARDRFAGVTLPVERLFFALRGASGTAVSLTGISLTSSAGTLTPGLSSAASGSAATASAGTLSSALAASVAGSAGSASSGSVASTVGVAPSGSAATSAAGTLTTALAATLAGEAGTGALGTLVSGIGMSVTGSALTVSAGSLAYTIGFTLTGVSSATAGGTLSTGGGDTTAERTLTGISMSALPGNVRVTGGTRWVPQQARAVAIATTAGNTMPPPPRLTGDIQTDIRAQQQYLQTFYDQFVKVNNVLGRINDHETRIASLEEGS